MNDSSSGTVDRASEPAADILSDVLHAVRLSGAVFFDVQASSPWAAEAPPASEVALRAFQGAGHVIPFHVLTEGSCYVGLIGEEAVEFNAGDVVIYPHGDAHVVSSGPGMRAPVDEESYRRATQEPLPVRVTEGGGSAPEARVICGFLGCDARPFNPIIENLPRQLIVNGDSTRDAWLNSFVEAALSESRNRQPGGETVLARMSELLFIAVLRRYVSELGPDARNWFMGLRDPGVGRALALLHREPAQPWTLEMLAQRSGMSRSVLAERFHELVGMPPMQYLARWRMQLAAKMLASGGRKIASIARDVGYDAEAAFSRAFKKLVGVSPTQWRRERGS